MSRFQLLYIEKKGICLWQKKSVVFTAADNLKNFVNGEVDWEENPIEDDDEE